MKNCTHIILFALMTCAATAQQLQQAETQQAQQAETQQAQHAETQQAQHAETQQAQHAETQQAQHAETQQVQQAETQRVRQAETQRVRQAETQRVRQGSWHTDASWYGRMTTDMHDGVIGVTEWYDAPLFVAFLARNYYKADNPSTKLLSIPASAFERNIAERIGQSGQESIGSLDAWLLPSIVLGGRVLWALGNNLVGDENMSGEYARAWTFARALMYNYLATELVKNVVSRPRPDGADTKSFFSGHTSSAFVTSAYLYRELDDLLDRSVSDATSRDVLKAFSFGVLYGWAGYVGYSRMEDNKHYLGDVLLGAAVGTLVGNLVFSQYFGDDNGHIPAIGLTMIEDQPALSVSFKF